MWVSGVDEPFVAWQPAVWRDFLGRAGAEDAGTAAFVDAYWPSSAGRSPVAPPIWLHGHQLVDGSRELTCLAVIGGRSAYATVQVVSWVEGTTATPPRYNRVSWDSPGLLIEKALATDPLTIYAATADPQDADGILIPYRLGRRTGVLRGHFVGHTVRFAPDAGWFDPASDRFTAGQSWDIDGTTATLRQVTTPAFTLALPPGSGRWGHSPSQLAFTADGRRLRAVVGEPPRVVGWDLTARKRCETNDLADPVRPGGETAVNIRAILSPDGQLCVTQADDPVTGGIIIRGVDLDSGHELGRATGEHGVGRPYGFSRDGRTVYFSAGDRLRAYDPRAWRERASANVPGLSSAWAWAIGRTRLTFRIGGGSDPDGSGHSVTLAADTLAVLAPHGLPFRSAVMTPDDGRLFEVRTDYRLPTNRPPNGFYETDVMTGVDRRLAAGGDIAPQYMPFLNQSAFSPDGHWWAVSGGSRAAYLWPYPGLNEIWRLSSPSAPEGEALAFSPDGRWLATGADGGVALWPVPR